MYTNTMRFTGLSGIDTEMMVRQLMRAESMRYDSLKKKNVLIEWRQEAYRNVALSLNTFQNTFLSLTAANNLRSMSTFNVFNAKATIGNAETSHATVSASAEAKEGSYKVEVLALAQTDKYKSLKDSSFSGFGGEIISEIDYAEIAARFSSSGYSGTLEPGESIRFTLNGLSRDIDIERLINGVSIGGVVVIGPATSAEDFGQRLQWELDSAFGENAIKGDLINGRLSFIVEEGKELTISELRPRTSVIKATGLPSEVAAGEYTLTINLKDPVTGIPRNVNVKVNFNSATDDAKTIADRINNAMFFNKDENGKDDGIYNIRAEVGSDGTIAFRATGTLDDVTISGGGGFLTGVGFDSDALVIPKAGSLLNDFGFVNGAKSAYNTKQSLYDIFVGGPIGTITQAMIDDPSNNKTISINGVAIKFNLITDTVEDLMDRINNNKTKDTGVRFSFDQFTRTFTLEAKETGFANKIQFGAYDDSFEFLQAMRFGEMSGTPALPRFDAYDTYQRASDAQVRVNDGPVVSSASNNVAVEAFGFSLKLFSKPADGEFITVNVARDSAKPLEAVKAFVEGYNKLIDELNKLVSTSRPRSGKYSYYDPLTDDERNAMSDKEIERWEEKAREGLLFRDAILSDITSSMRRLLYQSVEVADGVRMSLFDIGISTTSKYQEQGKLEIDENKLKRMLEERGDDVAKLFTKSSSILYSSVTGRAPQERLAEEGLAERINDIINDAVNSTSGAIARQAGIKGASSEANNTLYRQWLSNQNRLNEMLQALMKKEDYYFSMFSKMEAAMMQSNSQMQYLMAMMGQSV